MFIFLAPFLLTFFSSKVNPEITRILKLLIRDKLTKCNLHKSYTYYIWNF